VLKNSIDASHSRGGPRREGGAEVRGKGRVTEREASRVNAREEKRKKGTGDGGTKVCRARNAAKFVGSRRTLRYTLRTAGQRTRRFERGLNESWSQGRKRTGTTCDLVPDAIIRDSPDRERKSIEATLTGNENKNRQCPYIFSEFVA